MITQSGIHPYPLSRRSFIGAGLLALAGVAAGTASQSAPFLTRGVVLYPFDLTLTDWPALAHRAGLTTIALHAARHVDVLTGYIRSEPGQRFLRECRRLGLAVEYELHAMGDLLSREYLYRDPTLFRQNAQGQRVEDYNCCPSSPDALDIIGEKALEIAKTLKPTSHRYFYWPDDGREWCACRRCRGFSASEQSLLVGNHILRILRRWDTKATLSHLAYGPTIAPPQQVKPSPGIFLEFAPIGRSHDRPYAEQTPRDTAESIEMLDANLKVFNASEAQVLEYWLDVSRFSQWKRPAVRIPWKREVFLADVETYRRRGIRHLTSFACFIDAEYRQMHKDLRFIEEYGQGLSAP
jgi:hypothetical protein